MLWERGAPHRVSAERHPRLAQGPEQSDSSYFLSLVEGFFGVPLRFSRLGVMLATVLSTMRAPEHGVMETFASCLLFWWSDSIAILNQAV